jgi:thiamine-phosphate pyrophosphorylase
MLKKIGGKTMELRRSLALYVIPDRKMGKGRDLLTQARSALAGGATAIQLRDKELPGRDLYELAVRMKALCSEYGALFIVNDRLDVALAADCDGVHLGQEDLPVSAARRIVPPGFIIGASAHTPEEALKAERDGADYLGAGAVYPTGSKGDAHTIGIEGFRRVVKSTKLPVVAIGGIDAKNTREVIAEGACGISVISAVVSQEDIEAAARSLRRTVDSALSEREIHKR